MRLDFIKRQTLRLRRWLAPRCFETGPHAARADDDHQDVPVDENDLDPLNPFPEPVRLEIGDVFDLHTIAPSEVKQVTAAYLLEAHRAGFRTVRIIHGKGIGVQREAVRRILARTPFVLEWADAPAEAGGWGATVVRLAARETSGAAQDTPPGLR